jgi:hypothetical protein
MQRLMETCNTVLDVRNRGARLLARDDDTLILLDYDGIDSKQTMHIAELYPNVTVSIHESNASKSGYCVLFTWQSSAIWYKQRQCMQIVATLFFVLCLFNLLNIVHVHSWRGFEV